MKQAFESFLALHRGEEPLLIGNVWNVQSAKVFEQCGFKALATSSAAVAETLGYEDGQVMSFDEYLFVISRIAKSVDLLLSVDLEAGYGESAGEIVRNIAKLSELGVCGINIEDSIMRDGNRLLRDAGEFAALLRMVCSELESRNIKMFINVRCDVFLMGLADAATEGLQRIGLYKDTGVHGLFFPCITQPGDIEVVVKASELPVNVMCMPGLPSFSLLKEIGVKRISMGNFLNKKVYGSLQADVRQIVKDGSFGLVFGN
ncbi:MAG TPA: isocitrate lyase/phosphoenolpyruvate mutase family protein [Chitinophagaceae bacterium]|nr:isocitrate lyase/phosphoenolpyruvate mutase family protein [Chitinophagaceae bacterium]